jgi:hypothetical protein
MPGDRNNLDKVVDLRGPSSLGRTSAGVVLTVAELSRANLSGALLGDTVFSEADLTDTMGLDSCDHRGPSVLDRLTLARSRNLPVAFLRGVGLPDRLIEYLPSIFGGDPIQYYACFISCSARDHEFAHRLHADLQDCGLPPLLRRFTVPCHDHLAERFGNRSW